MAEPKKVKVFRWHLYVNSLWLWWYCLLVLAGEGYLIYRAVQRCKEYNEHQWQGKDKPVKQLYSYIVLIVLSVMCIPFMAMTSIFKVNNYANDGVRLGRDNVLEELEKLESSSGDNGGSEADDSDSSRVRGSRICSGKGFISSMWRHMGPFSNTFHIVAAFCLLFPEVLLRAQEIRHGFAPPEVMWQSELDILFQRETVIKPGYTYVVDDASTNQTGRSSHSPPVTKDNIVRGVSPEFANYVVALLLFSVRYASVFWYTRAAYSLVFSLQLVMLSIHFMFAFSGLEILYKYQVNEHATPGMPDLLLAPAHTLLLYLAANGIVFFSSIALFKYGYQQYDESYTKFVRRFFPSFRGQYSSRRERGDLFSVCQVYTPHIVASVCLLVVVACRAPVVYDYVNVYRYTNSRVLLTCVILDAVYLILWVCLWFGFTIKQNWHFRISPCAECFRRHNSDLHFGTRGGGVRLRQPRPLSAPELSNDEYLATADGAKPQMSNSGGNIAVPSTDGVDGAVGGNVEEDPDHPGVLKKTGDRRPGGSQRVTFHESAEQQKREGSLSPTRKGRRAGGREKKSHEVPNRDDAPRRPLSDSYLEDRLSGPSSDFDTQVGTPENTLTRNYRHSLRDTCGQYYRGVRDPSPAAHSSPIDGLPARSHSEKEPRQTDISSKQYALIARDEVDAKPSHRNISPQRPIRHPYVLDPGESPIKPHIEENPYVNTPSVGLRLPNKPLVQSGRLPARSEPLRNRDLDESSDLFPEQEEYLVDDTPPTVLKPKPPVYMPKIVNHPDGPQRKSGHGLYRDIRLIGKPELSRRDSALPSSNETSSTESENVLCSQV